MKSLSSSLTHKLEILVSKHDSLTNTINEQNIEPKAMIEASKELAKLSPVVTLYQSLLEKKVEREEAKLLLEDPQMQELAQLEITELDRSAEKIIEEIMIALVPEDPDNDKNVFLEIRAGTGGDEAALFAQNLYDMYLHFADQNKWQVEPIQTAITGQGGVKEAVALISGKMSMQSSNLKVAHIGYNVFQKPNLKVGFIHLHVPLQYYQRFQTSLK